MSLSEDERNELERLRKKYKQSRAREEAGHIFTEAVMLRGLFSSLIFGWTIPYFTPDTLFGRSVKVVGSLVCMTLGILSSYYGPFKKKKETKTE